MNSSSIAACSLGNLSYAMTFTPSPLNIFMKILAIFPVPTIPAVLPFKSNPVNPLKLKFPSLVLLYALSTLLAWAYYGQKSWNYLVGEGKKRTLTFQFIYCAFIVIGSVMNVTSVINITDAMMIAMSIPNIIAMYILAPEIKKDLCEYAKRHKIAWAFNKNWYKKCEEADA